MTKWIGIFFIPALFIAAAIEVLLPAEWVKLVVDIFIRQIVSKAL